MKSPGAKFGGPIARLIPICVLLALRQHGRLVQALLLRPLSSFQLGCYTPGSLSESLHDFLSPQIPMDRIRWLLATCGGVGYSPILPGTCGALWGIPIYWAILLYSPNAWHTALLGVALLVVCAITFWLSGWSEKYFGEEDSSRFVTDEVVGFLFTALLFRPPGTTDAWGRAMWVHTFTVFMLTRAIDISKIPPARRLENLPGGWGVLADDLLGSVYTALLLWGLWSVFPKWFN